MSDEEFTHMTGWQSFLFRANLVILPLLLTSVVALGTWLIQSQYRMASQLAVIEDKIQNVAFQDSVRVQLLEQRQRILKEISENYPPPELVEDVKELQVIMKEVQKDIRELEKAK